MNMRRFLLSLSGRGSLFSLHGRGSSVVVLLVLFVVCTFVTSSVTNAATGSKKRDAELAEAAYRAGKEMIENGAPDPAVDLFYKAVSLKKTKRYYIALGNALRDVERKSLAFFAFCNALDMIKDEKDVDYEGLVTAIVSMGIDLGHFEKVRSLLPKLDEYDPQLAQSARTRLLLQQGRQALAAKQFAKAYSFFSKAREIAHEDRPALLGCYQALDGAAGHFAEQGNHRKSLEVLIRLYRLASKPEVAIRVEGAFIRAGRPADLAEAVQKIKKEQPVE